MNHKPRSSARMTAWGANDAEILEIEQGSGFIAVITRAYRDCHMNLLLPSLMTTVLPASGFLPENDLRVPQASPTEKFLTVISFSAALLSGVMAMCRT